MARGSSASRSRHDAPGQSDGEDQETMEGVLKLSYYKHYVTFSSTTQRLQQSFLVWRIFDGGNLQSLIPKITLNSFWTSSIKKFRIETQNPFRGTFEEVSRPIATMGEV